MGNIKKREFGARLVRFLNKKSQGLPIYVIIIIILGIVVLALVLLYILGVTEQGGDISKSIFGIGGNITKQANETSFYGG